MFIKKLNTSFVSEVDKLLAKFKFTKPKSKAQQAEIEKYQKIYQLRDQAKASSPPTVQKGRTHVGSTEKAKIWEGF